MWRIPRLQLAGGAVRSPSQTRRVRVRLFFTVNDEIAVDGRVLDALHLVLGFWQAISTQIDGRGLSRCRGTSRGGSWGER